MNIDKKVNAELRKVLKESVFNSYQKEADELKPDDSRPARETKLTLGTLLKLSQMRKVRRQEIAIERTFVPYIYGPQEQTEEGGGMMGGGLGGGL